MADLRLEEFSKIISIKPCICLMCGSLQDGIYSAPEFAWIVTTVVDGSRPVCSELRLVELTLIRELAAPGFSVGVKTTATVDLLKTAGGTLHCPTLVVIPPSVRTSTRAPTHTRDVPVNQLPQGIVVAVERSVDIVWWRPPQL